MKPDHSVDIISGGPGDDLISSTDSAKARDIISCGSGFDRVETDPGDRVAKDCEKVGAFPG